MGAPTLRSNALTTLEAVRIFTDTSEDDARANSILTILINEASEHIERAVSRKLRRAQYTERLAGNGRQKLVLYNYPIVNVEYIKQAGETVDPGLYDYLQEAEQGIIYKDDGWPVAGYPAGLAGDIIMDSRNIEVAYTAGYVLPGDETEANPVTLPADLEGLARDMVLSAFGKLQTGGNAGLKAFSISDVRWEWQHEAPESWQQIIDDHRRSI